MRQLFCVQAAVHNLIPPLAISAALPAGRQANGFRVLAGLFHFTRHAKIGADLFRVRQSVSAGLADDLVVAFDHADCFIVEDDETLPIAWVHVSQTFNSGFIQRFGRFAVTTECIHERAVQGFSISV